jgi:hypothetical protein
MIFQTKESHVHGMGGGARKCGLTHTCTWGLDQGPIGGESIMLFQIYQVNNKITILIFVLQVCVIVALQGCVIVVHVARLRDCCVARLRDCCAARLRCKVA